jgi:tetratricopeptide (TPR) repeat protein
MTESDYVTELKSRWPTDEAGKREATLETLALADEAVRAFPRSAPLWVIRGNLLELGPEACALPLEESLVCYKKAIEIDPHYAEAWDEVGHFYDAVLNDERAAQPYFHEASRLRGQHAETNHGS